MKLSHRLATVCLLAVPFLALAAEPAGATKTPAGPAVKPVGAASMPAGAAAMPVGSAPSELKLMGVWQAVTVMPGLGGRDVVEPKRNDSILEFQPGHDLRLHAPCGTRRDGLVLRGESLYVAGSWSLSQDGKLRIQASIGGKEFDETVPVRMTGDRLLFVNGTSKPDEFVRYTAPIPVQCE